MPNKYLTVSALNKYLSYRFDNDEYLKSILIEGEISNFKRHYTGHLYFTLKDPTSEINAIMFSSYASKLDFEPKEGDFVYIRGDIKIYEAKGTYQVYVQKMVNAGVGNLQIEFLKLKEKLEKEGLFDNSRKKPIPKYPKRIGVITSPTGAAIEDILSITAKRYPIAQIIFFPTTVQGKEAESSIINSLKKANDPKYNLDVIILGRGGGSIEDLWCFNLESVAREVANSIVPVASGVGHETDFTITDFVADKRFETPSGAALGVTPDKLEIQNKIRVIEDRIRQVLINKIDNYSQKLNNYLDYLTKYPSIYLDSINYKLTNLDVRLDKEKPAHKLDNLSLSLKHLDDKLVLNYKNLIESKKINLDNLLLKLELVNPLSLLRKGYSITYKNFTNIKSIKEVNINDEIETLLEDGKIISKVIKKEENDGK